MDEVDALMQQGVRDSIFPGGVLLVTQDNTIRWFKAYGYANPVTETIMTRETVFDLASLTKPLATALAIMKLVQESKLSLHQRIGTILPPFEDSDKGDITIQQLLNHTSGLPDYKPYYKELVDLPEAERRVGLRDMLAKEPLILPIGAKTLYSDLGFMILSWVIEMVSGKRLDRFVTEDIYQPLSIEQLFFAGARKPARDISYAATENCPWRKKLLVGEVHDDNAWVVGGIEGHAGLFGTAHEVYRLLAMLLESFQRRSKTDYFKSNIIRSFLTKSKGCHRVLGFDVPSDTDSSSGRFFSDQTVGHLGFTGTSFWMDLKQNIIVILLTNRIHPKRDNQGIRAFRPKLHDAVMLSLKSEV